MYLCTRLKFLGKGFQKLEHEHDRQTQTDRQTRPDGLPRRVLGWLRVIPRSRSHHSMNRNAFDRLMQQTTSLQILATIYADFASSHWTVNHLQYFAYLPHFNPAWIRLVPSCIILHAVSIAGKRENRTICE